MPPAEWFTVVPVTATGRCAGGQGIRCAGKQGLSLCHTSGAPPGDLRLPRSHPHPPLLTCRIPRVFWQDFLLPGGNSAPSQSLQHHFENSRCPGAAVSEERCSASQALLVATGPRLCKLVSKNADWFGREAPRFALCYSGMNTEALRRSQQRRTEALLVSTTVLGHLLQTSLLLQ